MSAPTATAPVTTEVPPNGSNRTRGPRILVWGDDPEGAPRVERPAIALGARLPKPTRPDGRPVVVTEERGKTWTAELAADELADLPPAPRVRCASKSHGREVLREQVRRDPEGTFSAVRRLRTKGGRWARVLLTRAAVKGHPVMVA